MLELDQNDPFVLFEESIKSEETKKAYIFYLKKYMKFLDGQDPLFHNDARAIESKIIELIISMKNKENKSYFSIRNHVSAIFAFYKINDIVLNINKIIRFIPAKKKANRDRAYTHEEIHRLLEIVDERMRTVIMLLASTGMRIGAISSLRLRNLQKIFLNNSEFEIYKITVYENYEEEYFTYCTPECVKAIDDYLGMRSRYGEKLNQDSLLIREQFGIRDPFAVRKSIAIKPISLSIR